MKPIQRFVLAIAIVGTAFLLVGDRHDPFMWAYLGLFSAVGLYALLSIDEDLARERFTPPSKGADGLSLRQVRLVAMTHILAGFLDNRFKWTTVPDAWRLAGLVGFTLGFLLIVQAMKTNRFFSSVVRIQKDRGHHVVDQGPYSFIRHPGYAGMMPAIPFGGLAMGSWIAVAAGLLYTALILRRVIFEDDFLKKNLEGYSAYAGRVRYRLVPGVW
ncbi:MAG: isoprenylcysteine carboxylmethyltransferase family protein [Vicinamibacterales bacterium]